MMNTWLHYYNNKDHEARPLGRVRVYRLANGTYYISSMKTYKEIMKRINEQDKNGKLAFIGASAIYNSAVYVRTFDLNSYPMYQYIGKVESVF